MANEAKTDLWVSRLLEDAGVELEPQGSSIVEVDNALKSASKKKNGNKGAPDFIGAVKDFLIVVEDKPEFFQHIKLDNNGLIDETSNAVIHYAVNGALHYAKHLAAHTSYKKIVTIAVAGNAKQHKITPFFVTDTMPEPIQLEDVESFISFNATNIDEWYTREVLQEDTSTEKETAAILRDAAALHEDLRNYGNLKDIDKPLVVSGILLALSEIEYKNFDIDSLTGDTITTDGQKIFDAIEAALKRAKVDPVVKRDKVLSQFSIIKDTVKLNEVNLSLGKSPLKHYTEFLYDSIFKAIKYTRSSEDYLGRFYGEFMSYSGGDGQTLGIVLTPKHITELFCDLANLQADDVVFDPCCGTAGFLIAAMHRMFKLTIMHKGLKTRKEIDEDPDIQHIRQAQLGGFELQPYMFTIATTNMILRGDGKSNIINADFLAQDPKKLQIAVTRDKKGNQHAATVGMINPPYSQGSKKNPDLYEINFIKHLLDSLSKGSRCIAIVPQSSVTGKNKDEQVIKEEILRHHTLEGVITLNKDTFYGVGVHPVIAVFTAHEKHPINKKCKFINFENDGYKVAQHIGLMETESAKDKKQHLLDVWFGRMESETKFCVETTVEASDEWLHSFYYFNDELPDETDFDNTINDYLSFEFAMIMQGRDNILERGHNFSENQGAPFKLGDRRWVPFDLTGQNGLFELAATKSGIDKNKLNCTPGNIPYITRSDSNNGISMFVTEKQNSKYAMDSKGVITIGLDTQTCFYQPSAFYTGQNIQVLSNKRLNKYCALFICTSLRQQLEKFCWGGNGATLGRLKRTKVLLPADSSGAPDYDFMSHFIKEREAEKLSCYFNFSGNNSAS